MKKVLFLIIAILMMPLALKANPPKKVELSYNPETKKLKVEVLHPVKDPQEHYIDLISISVNGKEVKAVDFKKQFDKNNQLLEVEIPEIVPGCEVVAMARCNRFGTKKGTLRN